MKSVESQPRAGHRPNPGAARGELLADVAEMYFLEGKTQAQIARKVGVTRSMVSRMLSEARAAGIVEFSVRRPLSLDAGLAADLEKRFGLRQGGGGRRPRRGVDPPGQPACARSPTRSSISVC